MTKDYLTDIEVVKIEAFCADTELYNAVRKVVLQGIFHNGVVEKGYIPDPLINGAFSLVALAMENPIPNELLGEQLRAQWAGINAMHNAFKELNNIKSDKVEDGTSPYNEAE